MISKLPITVAILLGGESRRFGSPKAFLQWNGKSLAARLAETANPLASEVLFVGKNETQIPEDAKSLAKFINDEPGFAGPLAGLAAALTHASKPWVFLTGVDKPRLNGKVIREFWKLREKSVLLQAVIPYVENRWQPLCGLWNLHALTLIKSGAFHNFQHLLNEGGLKMIRVEEPTLRAWDPELLCLRGFNTKEEWEKLQQVEL